MLLEFGINALSLPTILVRFVYFLLLSLTFVREKTFGGEGNGKGYQEPEKHEAVYWEEMGEKHQIGTFGEKEEF